MAQNKRYKRLAKRLKGNCIECLYYDNNNCKYEKQCDFIMFDLDLDAPMCLDIRKLREVLKGTSL